MQSLKGPYAEAATALKEFDAEIILAKVDATEEKTLGEKFEIKGFPTLKWFVDGKVAMDYGGGRSASDIVAWIKKKTGPPSTVLDSAEALDKAKKEEVSMFAYFTKFEGDAHTTFESLASKTDDTSFFKTSDAEVAKALGLESDASYAVGRNYPGFDYEIVVSADHEAMKGSDSLEASLDAFLAIEKLPAFLEFSQDTAGRIFNSGIKHQVIIVSQDDDFKVGAALRKAIVDASAKTRGKIVWVTNPIGNQGGAPIITYFGLDKESKEPQVVGFVAEGGTKYQYPKDKKVDAKNLAAFAQTLIDGTAERMTKSAPVPAEPEDEGVRVVVGTTVEEIVMDPSKDVLLEVYAPWCGHCKALAPDYAKLAQRFKSVDSVVIAKMDGTENEHPEIEVKGYPTLLFYPAEKGAKPIPMNAGRDLPSLTKFIKDNAKIAFELPKEEATKEEAEADAEEHDEL